MGIPVTAERGDALCEARLPATCPAPRRHDHCWQLDITTAFFSLSLSYTFVFLSECLPFLSGRAGVGACFYQSKLRK